MNEPTLLNKRYEIKEILGRGGFATTYLAIDTVTQRECAIKCLSFRKIEDWKTWELFEREAKILKNLDHPQIPKYLDFFTIETDQDVEICLVQEYIAGKSLAQLVREGKHFTEDEVIRLALKLLRVLEYLHALSPPIIHRDLKPGNITLSPEDRAYVIDFGAVKDTLASEYTKSSGVPTVVGTYGYMALEQIEGRALPASDIYALGMTLIALLAHKEPTEMEKTGLLLDFRPHVNISDRFARILAKMVAPDYSKRYQTAAAVRADLESLRIQKERDQRGDRYKILLAALVLLLFLAGFGVYWVLRAFTPTPPETVTEQVTVSLSATTATPAPQPTAPAYIPIATRTPTLLSTFTPVPQPTAPAYIPIATQTPILLSTPTPASTSTPKPAPAATSTPEPLPPLSIRGRLLFDGRPITDVTTVQPTFWLRNEDTGKEQAATVRYENGAFFVHGLPLTGNFGISVNIDANPQNRWIYPGDFNAWRQFSLTLGINPELALDLAKIMHLTSPQDNGAVLPGWDWGTTCMAGVTLTNPVTFRWEALDANVSYDYEITRLNCLNNYNSAGTAANATITQTEVTVNLPPNLPNECYGFRVSARKDGRRVGMLITHGASGYGWDYRFRVR